MLQNNVQHKLNNVVQSVTKRIMERSTTSRAAYLTRMKNLSHHIIERSQLSCTNLAHQMASSDNKTKIQLKQISNNSPKNIGIISAYNDVLSAHAPYYNYPELIKAELKKYNVVAQVAAGVPAMCDGITQGQVGMELSLFSRDVIALSTAVALSHNVFDAGIYLGICDKIVPGLLIGALSFGFLPAIFIPSGPMASGLSNVDKTTIRKKYASGMITKEELLEYEMKAYHSSGTCTFYGTANSNQMLMEIMGLQLPGSSFINPNTTLRNLLTNHAIKQIANIVSNINNINEISNHHTSKYSNYSLSEIITEKTIVNAIVGLAATGGSTNHMIHIPAIAKAAGIIVSWDDFDEISQVVPLIANIYPNGQYDINDFNLAGGMPRVIAELLSSGLLHEDVNTIMGNGLSLYTKMPVIDTINPNNQSHNPELSWRSINNSDTTIDVIRPINNPFQNNGGLRLLTGNLGRSISKISAIAPEHRYIKAPAVVFYTQNAVIDSYKQGKLNKDCVIVLCYHGPNANGMPELHGLMPSLLSLQDLGYKIGLVTDGRLSGASGKIPNAIHLIPDSTSDNSIIAKVRDDDILELDLVNGTLNVLLDSKVLLNRTVHEVDLSKNNQDVARELFRVFRNNVSDAESGASIF